MYFSTKIHLETQTAFAVLYYSNYWKDLVSHMVFIYGPVTYVDMERSYINI